MLNLNAVARRMNSSAAKPISFCFALIWLMLITCPIGNAADVAPVGDLGGDEGAAADVRDWAWSIARPAENPNAWEIRWGDRLVTTYHNDLAGTPGFFPLQTPRELELTRQFPIGEIKPFEKEDHDHHRSMWFTHGIVNDLDFWVEDNEPHVGKVVHQTGEISIANDALVLNTRNDWVDAGGKQVLSDQRRFRFSHARGDTLIDVTVRLNATNGDVIFGDTKEGTFGLRVAGTMKVDAQEIDAKLGGTIINAEGLTDKAAWSQKSDWVDYSGPILPKQANGESETLSKEELLAGPLDQGGVTMMYHPGSDLPECRWHVRTYGLFAANPFGRKHFGLEEYDGVTINSGDSLTLNFRLVLHDGTFDESKTKRHYAEFSKAPADRIDE